jgi:hypothetical protein
VAAGRHWRYALAVARQIEPGRAAKPSLAKRGVAALVLVAIAAVAVVALIHILVTIFWIVAVVAVVVAALWAAKTLF